MRDSKKYYEDQQVVIYHGDARAMVEVEDSTVQLVVTSPPYNVGMEYDVYEDRVSWEEWEELGSAALIEVTRLLRPGGVLAWNVPFTVRQGRQPNMWIDAVAFRSMKIILDSGLLYRDTLVWVKGQREGEAIAVTTACGSDNNPYLRPVAEAVLLFSKSQYYLQGLTGRWGNNPLDLCKNVWHIPSVGHREHDHPTPFPLRLPMGLVELYSQPGTLVLDPFMGSGTTLLAAKKLGRRAVGYEVSEAYCKLARERCCQMIMGMGT